MNPDRLTRDARDALTLWTVPRWSRAEIARRLGIHPKEMSDMCLIYCQGRKLLSDMDQEVLRLRRGRGKRRPTPEELQAQVKSAGPRGMFLPKEDLA